MKIIMHEVFGMRDNPQRHQKKTDHPFPVRKHLLLRVPLRLWSYVAFLGMSLLSTSFYPVAVPALAHLDTVIFVAVQMLWLIPPAWFLLAWSGWQIRGKTLLYGVVLGSCMASGLLCLTLSMQDTSMTETALFSCLHGVIVMLVSWLVCGQRVQRLTWLACLCSTAAMVLLLCASQMHWTGDVLAVTGGLLLTGYSFLVERLSAQMPQLSPSLRAVCGIQWLTMVIETCLAALLFGEWRTVHFLMPSDLLICGYVGLATTLLPMMIMLVMRRYVSGITVAFIAMVEPIVTAGFAYFLLHERFLPLVYAGGVLAVGSMLLQALASRTEMHASDSQKQQERGRGNRLLYEQLPALSSEQEAETLMKRAWPGRRARALLIQLWQAPDGVDLVTLQRLTGVPCGCAYRLLASWQRQGYIVSSRQKMHEGNGYRLCPSWQVSGSLQQEFRMVRVPAFFE
jgi:drug/metabolite transporter (DMT)-like permease